jgi:hypothetical protein
MSSGILIDESSTTTVSFDTIPGPDIVVESHGGGNETHGSEKIVSLVKLLEKFGCIKKCGSCYVCHSLNEKF